MQWVRTAFSTSALRLISGRSITRLTCTRIHSQLVRHRRNLRLTCESYNKRSADNRHRGALISTRRFGGESHYFRQQVPRHTPPRSARCTRPSCKRRRRSSMTSGAAARGRCMSGGGGRDRRAVVWSALPSAARWRQSPLGLSANPNTSPVSRPTIRSRKR
jgi:hypothetical protein